MRVSRRQTTLGLVERLARRAPTVAATPLAGGPVGPEGPAGPKGATGAEGAKGATGAAGPTSGGLILVRAATTAALAANTAPTITTLEASANGALASQDGIALAVGDRLLVKNEATGSHNGVYEVTSLGSGAAKWKLTRIASMDESSEVVGAMQFNILQGTKNAATTWVLTTTGAIVLGTTALTFSLVEKENPINNTAGEDLKVIRGIVNTTTPTIVKGAGFTIAKTTTGTVTITFTAAFADIPSVHPDAGESAGALTAKITSGSTVTSGAVSLVLFNSSTTANVDGIINFLAIGPR